jgi:hypothetical protein
MKMQCLILPAITLLLTLGCRSNIQLSKEPLARSSEHDKLGTTYGFDTSITKFSGAFTRHEIDAIFVALRTLPIKERRVIALNRVHENGYSIVICFTNKWQIALAESFTKEWFVLYFREYID